jgi:hypothetical protein
MTPRTIYWAVKLESGEVIKGVKENAVCSFNAYLSILGRKYQKQGWKHLSVGIDESAQIV